MRSLHAKQARVKFLGSYPAVGEHAEVTRADTGSRWDDADNWLAEIRKQIR
jgi:prephenate dehydratase